MWEQREIENYLSRPQTLKDFARNAAYERTGLILFDRVAEERRAQLMEECIKNRAVPAALSDPEDSWWKDTQMSDDFLDKVFPEFFERLRLPSNIMRKSDYYLLAKYVDAETIPQEVRDVLDQIVNVARNAKPLLN